MVWLPRSKVTCPTPGSVWPAAQDLAWRDWVRILYTCRVASVVLHLSSYVCSLVAQLYFLGVIRILITSCTVCCKLRQFATCQSESFVSLNPIQEAVCYIWPNMELAFKFNGKTLETAFFKEVLIELESGSIYCTIYHIIQSLIFGDFQIIHLRLFDFFCV